MYCTLNPEQFKRYAECALPAMYANPEKDIVYNIVQGTVEVLARNDVTSIVAAANACERTLDAVRSNIIGKAFAVRHGNFEKASRAIVLMLATSHLEDYWLGEQGDWKADESIA